MKNQKINTIGWLIFILVYFALFIPGKAQSSLLEIARKGASTTNSDVVNKANKNEMSPEERVVRLAYKKLSLYNTILRYRQAKQDKKNVNHDLALKFELKKIRTGPISEILNTPHSKLTSLPTGETVMIGRVVSQFNREEENVSYLARWVNGQYASIYDRGWTIGNILQFEPLKHHDVGKYTSYEVTVSLEGKSRTYNALCLFHNPYQSSKELKPEFWDSVVGMGGSITRVWEEKLLPPGIKHEPLQLENTLSKSALTSEELEKPIRKSNQSENTKIKIGKNFANLIKENTGIVCSTNKADLSKCCIDTDLAKLWKVNACDAWKTNLDDIFGIDVEAIPGSKSDLTEVDYEDFIQFHASDNLNHYSGWHHGRARFRPICEALPDNRQRCEVRISDIGYGDSGAVNSIYYHVGTLAYTDRGNSGPRGQDLTCENAVGFAFDNCLFSDCGVSIQLSISGSGVGATATVSGGNLWRAAKAEGNICRIEPTGGGGACLRPHSCFDINGEPTCCPSPIVIDIAGNGFNLTSAAGGVRFDINGDEVQEQIAWTSGNSDEVWLALDRNGNGTIDSGRELFGNFTPQPELPAGEQKNGFRALAVYDKVGNGGNNDGQIDSRDAIFTSLKLWQDRNHNGISEANELKNLSNSDVRIIELDYHESRRQDEHGNWFRYRAKVKDIYGAQVGRWAWDVFLQVIR